MKILILGIGSIGGVFSSRLLKGGYDCTLVTNNCEITNAIKKNGIKVIDGKNVIYTNVQSYTHLSEINNVKFDLIIFLMKATALEKAAKDAKSLLKEDGLVVTFQNGIVTQIVEKYFPGRVISGIVGWGSSMLEPGVYKITSKAKLKIGSLNSGKDLNIAKISNILSLVSDIEVSNNIKGVLWSKLAINCCINSIAGISGQTIGEMVKSKDGRKLFLNIYREVIELAELKNIKLEPIVSDPYRLYLSSDAGIFKKYLKDFFIKIMGKKYSKVKPSMLQDLTRSRKTEIEYLNGYIVKNAGNHPVPFNKVMSEMIKNIEFNLLNNSGQDEYLVPHPQNIPIALSKATKN